MLVVSKPVEAVEEVGRTFGVGGLNMVIGVFDQAGAACRASNSRL